MDERIELFKEELIEKDWCSQLQYHKIFGLLDKYFEGEK